jgi:hypothetical protein
MQPLARINVSTSAVQIFVVRNNASNHAVIAWFLNIRIRVVPQHSLFISSQRPGCDPHIWHFIGAIANLNSLLAENFRMRRLQLDSRGQRA